jgi:hypothetical protein
MPQLRAILFSVILFGTSLAALPDNVKSLVGGGGIAGGRKNWGRPAQWSIAEFHSGSGGYGSAAKNIHMEVASIPGTGTKVFGIGKGGSGKPRPKDLSAAGFEGCKLGTGHDGNWYITGERYVYGPGLGIHFGAEYTMLYSDKWCGDGWYRPNGSQYYENKNHFHIPHPSDYGYEYWEWYNVAFWYDPMPSDMSSEEGDWTAKWWDDGSNNCSKTYTVMYDLSDHKMCADVQGSSPYDPIDVRNVFDPEDEKCYSWMRFDNYALNWSPDVKWRWFGPEGFYWEYEYDIPDPGSGSWHTWYKTWCSISIAGSYPATHPGAWHVDVYVKDYQGNYEHKFTDNFTIGSGGEPDIRIEPLFLALTCSAGQGGQWRALNSIEAQESLDDGPQQSTTGPVPPPWVEPKVREEARLESASEMVIPVPAYSWRHGCGPTALGMVIGYYDGQGYDDLIPGSASTQTADVNQAVASGGDSSNPYPPGSEEHYEDYSRPEDSFPTLLTDDYITQGRPAHGDNCIADYMDTSKSTRNNYYGWSWSDDVGPAFVSYVALRDPNYDPTYEEFRTSNGTLTWEVLTQEIDSNRPMVFLVDTDGDNETDHFVTAAGYRDAPTLQYGCLDTWEPADVIRWCDFAEMEYGQPWGIWGGWSFGLAPLSEGSFTIYNDGNSTLSVSSIVPETPADWLDWSPKAPFDVSAGSNQVVTVSVDCNSAPCGETTTRLLVYSNDPNENPYPDGVNVAVTKPKLDGDFDQNCCVGFEDLATFCIDWLSTGCGLETDLYLDCNIDFLDFSILARNWHDCVEW